MINLKDVNSLSIVGMGKNTGKTTFLTRVIEACSEPGLTRNLALTSIGRDGEETDIVTHTPKPRIYIRKGTLVATASGLLRSCDVTRDLLMLTDIRTTMGQVVIFRALSDGYVEIGGPSRTSDIAALEKTMRQYQKDCLFIVDGALSRMSVAARMEGTVLCTGAALSRNLDVLVDKTLEAVDMISLSKTDIPLPDKEGRVMVKDGTWRSLQSEMALSAGDDIRSSLTETTEAVFLKGAITEGLIEDLLRSPLFRNMRLIGKDGTRFMLTGKLLQRLKERNITLQVVSEIRLLAIVINPWEAEGDGQDVQEMEKTFRARTNLPVLDARGYEGRLFHGLHR
ncbi:MAG TPA: hypothetical protein VLN47_10290 [Clostridiaceae bacterium]|nr:hypothetical protein [Clostridiaceae bacterium]